MPEVPRLADLCKRVLKANVASLQDVGDVPYEFLADILPGCRVDQLREIEDLSPHIAEEDEEIWEMFFKRDFPIVAEARATTLHKPSASNHASTSARTLNEEDPHSSLFSSYRDLYYDEQVRREERLASAGTRLKERIANIAQRKQERRTILDPRLGLANNKRRARRVGPIGTNTHWSQREYKPKTLAEKARIKAGNIAFAYHPPRSTRASTIAVNYVVESSKGKEVQIPSRPSYKEEGEEEIPSMPVKKGSTSRMKFVERTVNVPKRSTMERPYKVVNGQLALASPAMSPSTEKPTEPIIPMYTVTPQDSEPPRPKKVIPGITRRPKPVNLAEEKAKLDSDYAVPAEIQLPSHISPHQHFLSANTALSISPPSSNPASPFFSDRAGAISPRQLSPPLHSSLAPPSLPMLGHANVKRPVPNMFIPRKKVRPA